MLICWFHAFRFLGVFGPQAGEALAIFFWKSSKLNKEFNEPIPRPPSGLESPQNWVLRYVVVKHAFFVFFLCACTSAKHGFVVHSSKFIVHSSSSLGYVTKSFLNIKKNIKMRAHGRVYHT